jgi:hypothetical protein
MRALPYDDRGGWIWLDGEFVPWRSAKVRGSVTRAFRIRRRKGFIMERYS